MKYSRFEELPVWQAALELAEKVYTFTSKPVWQGHYSLRDQLERAVISISNNIAEGFERGTTQELINFLYIARGSAAEVRSMFCVLDRLPSFKECNSEISGFKSRAESISRQLRAWADSLQNTPIKGPRYLTDKERQKSKAAQEREEFLKQLRESNQAQTGKPEA